MIEGEKRMHILSWTFICALVLGLVTPGTDARDWPRFRGPQGSGTSNESKLPKSWDENENLVWKTKLPGPGSSSPVTTGEYIFLTCYTGYGLSKNEPGDQKNLRLHLLCLDRKDGHIKWKRQINPEHPTLPFKVMVNEHGFASSTPVTDGKHVFAFLGSEGVFAFDLAGKLAWKADVGAGLGKSGSGSSPILFEGLVIVNACVESNAVVAIDKQTGAEVWRAKGLLHSWSTPILLETQEGNVELIVNNYKEVLGFDPRTGEKLWWCEGIDASAHSSPVAKDGIVYVTGAGSTLSAVAVRAGGRGNVNETHLLWKLSQGKSNVSSPVVHGDHLYWVANSAIACCVNRKTGQFAYRKRIPNAVSIFASPLAADGRIYAVSRNHGTFVYRAQPEFEQVAHNVFKSDESIFNASPAVDHGGLLIRSNRFLYRIEVKNPHP